VSAPIVTANAGQLDHRPLRMTFEEYLAWDYEGGLTEWVNGEVIIFMSATELHQRVVEFLMFLLRSFVELRGLGRVIGAPYVMRAIPGESGREPDAMFIATEHLSRLGDKYLDGPADLVLETISEDSVSCDRRDKFREYEEAGVREYWVIDARPRRKRADFYVRDASGHFRLTPVSDDSRYESTVLPGFWLLRSWLWEEAPQGFGALAEIIGPEELVAAIRARAKQTP